MRKGEGGIRTLDSFRNYAVYNASATGKVNKIIRKEKDGYEITIDIPGIRAKSILAIFMVTVPAVHHLATNKKGADESNKGNFGKLFLKFTISWKKKKARSCQI